MNGIKFDEHVSSLKQELLNGMMGPLQRFHERTGVMPKDIRVIMLDTTTHGAQPSYVLSGVRVEFDL
jgi:hypothetical protein